MNKWIKTCAAKQNSIRCPQCRGELGSPSTWVKGQTGIIKMFREIRSISIKLRFLKNKINTLENKMNTKNRQIEELQKKLEAMEESMDVICLN